MSANGTRFHGAERADGPLVLLHGFPEFWWTGRAQLTSLSAAGYRVAAPDMRGYDLITAASDAASLIRSLGEANAVGSSPGSRRPTPTCTAPTCSRKDCE